MLLDGYKPDTLLEFTSVYRSCIYQFVVFMCLLFVLWWSLASAIADDLLYEGIDHEEDVHDGEGDPDDCVEAESNGGESDDGEEEDEEEDETKLGMGWDWAECTVVETNLL